MKKTLKLITILSIGLASIYGFAQEHCKPEHKEFHNPKVMLEKLDAKLNLNKTQEKRVLTLLENRLEEHTALKQKMRAFHKGDRTKMVETMKSVLTEEQLLKFKALKTNAKHNENCSKGDKLSYDKKAKRVHHKKQEPSKRLERLTKELDLSKSQQETLEVIFKEKRKGMPKKQSQFKAERKKMKADFMKDMKAILSPEQFETFKELKASHHLKKRQMHKH